MKIRRTSEFSGITREIDLPITEEQLQKYQNGELIQRAFSNLTPDQREFIQTGITAEEWEQIFGDEE